MICPKCYSEIPDDSSYCDLCGIKILVCPACGILGTEKHCLVDNSEMIVKGIESFEKKFLKTERKSKAVSEKHLLLVNKTLSIRIKVQSGDVIGRRSDTSVSELEQFNQISSKHIAIEFKTSVGWFVTDLNSTNGTKLNGDKLTEMKPTKIKLGDTITLANIEFFITE